MTVLLNFLLGERAKAGSEDLALLFGRYAVGDLDTAYGTVVLYHSDGRYHHYVSNLHTIPAKALAERQIAVELQIRAELASEPAEIFAWSSGYDLVVLRVPVEDSDKLSLLKFELISSSFSIRSKGSRASNAPCHYWCRRKGLRRESRT